MKTRVTEKVQNWQRQATEKAKDAGRAADHYIRDNTWTSIACAALVGCVLGFLLVNRRSREVETD